MITTDFHLHTKLSVDAEAELDGLVRRAIEIGLTEIAITEHVDFNPADEGAGLYNPTQAYEQILAARKKFDGQIEIRYGVELSEPHLYIDEMADIYKMPLDVVIGSLHYVGPFGVHLDFFDAYDDKTRLIKYFDDMLKMVSQSDMDVLGHVDYFARYASFRGLPSYNPEDYAEQIKSILSTIIEREIALEINTSGWRAPANHCFPKPEIIKQYYDIGGRLLSIGSDAHKEKDIGRDIDRAAMLAKDIGFKEYHIFRKRRRVSLPL